jgi:hypothetical protein
MNLKNEINSRFMGDRSRVDRLAELTTQEIESLHTRMTNIENAMSLMQETFMNMERMLLAVLQEGEDGGSKEAE